MSIENKDYTPNGNTWLSVLIQRYMEDGLSYDDALKNARRQIGGA